MSLVDLQQDYLLLKQQTFWNHKIKKPNYSCQAVKVKGTQNQNVEQRL